MKIILNTTNLTPGGGMQVAYSVIHECRKYDEHEFHVFLGATLSAQIDKNKFPPNFFFYEFEGESLFSVFNGIATINKLTKAENSIRPDVVFSVFGPSYWSPEAPHLMGFAIPYFIYRESPYFKQIGLAEHVKWLLLSWMKKFFFLRNAAYYHVETADVKRRLSGYLSVSPEQIFTISNTCNAVYAAYKENPVRKSEITLPGSYNLLCLSAYYKHKNLEILNKVIPVLKSMGYQDVNFVLTLKPEIYEQLFTVEAKSQITNLGPLPVSDCPEVYSLVDAVFLPTLLECFSANYPEAMIMEKPVLTSDLGFAREICRDAALYFDPLHENDIAEKIIQLMNDEDLQKTLVENGKERLKDFDTAESRTRKYLDACGLIVKNSGN